MGSSGQVSVMSSLAPLCSHIKSHHPEGKYSSKPSGYGHLSDKHFLLQLRIVQDNVIPLVYSAYIFVNGLLFIKPYLNYCSSSVTCFLLRCCLIQQVFSKNLLNKWVMLLLMKASARQPFSGGSGERQRNKGKPRKLNHCILSSTKDLTMTPFPFP